MRNLCSWKEKSQGLKNFKTFILENFNLNKVIFEMRAEPVDYCEYLDFDLSDSEIENMKELIFENYYKHGLLAATLPKEGFLPKGRSKRLLHPVETKNEKLTKEKILQELILLHYTYHEKKTGIILEAVSLHIVCEAIKKIINTLKDKKLDYSLYEKILMFFMNKIKAGAEICILEYTLWISAFRPRLVYNGRKEVNLIFSNYDPVRIISEKNDAHEEMHFLKSQYNIDINFYVIKDLLNLYNAIKSSCASRNIAFTHKIEDVENALLIILEATIIYSRPIVDSLKIDFLKGFKAKEIKENNKVQNFSLHMSCRYYIADNFCKSKKFYSKIEYCSASPYNIKQSAFYILKKILNKNSDLICNVLLEEVSIGIALDKHIKLYEKSKLSLLFFRPNARSRYRLNASLEIDWKDLEEALTNAGIGRAEITFLRNLVEREDILGILWNASA